MCVLKLPSSAAVGAAGTGCTAHRCFSVIARLLVPEQLFRATSFREILFAPHSKAPALQISSVKRTQSTRRDKDGTLFLSACRISNLCTHEVHRWESESGIAGGLGANSSWYGGSSTHLWASSSCVLLTLRPSGPGASTRSEHHSTLRSSSSTWSRST